MKFVKAKIQYEKVNEDGSQAMVNESYLVDAMSFTEAEARITEEMAPFINGEFEITGLVRKNFTELVDANGGETIYIVSYDMCYVDEKSGREKYKKLHTPVRARDFEDALETFLSYMKVSIMDYKIRKIEETDIVDIFIYGHTDSQHATGKV